MQPLPPRSGPTATGRFWALSIGLVFGGLATLYMLKDYELIKRLDDPNDNQNRPFRVSFKPAGPLVLKPEAQARIDAQKQNSEES